MTNSILVIEGNRSLRLGIALALRESGFAVMTIPDYFEALAVLSEFRPRLVILDGTRSLVDGWQACSQLSQLLGAPIILLGRDSSSEAWVKAMEVGADFYLREPFSYLELVARVKAILRRCLIAAEADTIVDERAFHDISLFPCIN